VEFELPLKNPPRPSEWTLWKSQSGNHRSQLLAQLFMRNKGHEPLRNDAIFRPPGTVATLGMNPARFWTVIFYLACSGGGGVSGQLPPRAQIAVAAATFPIGPLRSTKRCWTIERGCSGGLHQPQDLGSHCTPTALSPCQHSTPLTPNCWTMGNGILPAHRSLGLLRPCKQWARLLPYPAKGTWKL